jgi:hypothetical protein
VDSLLELKIVVLGRYLDNWKSSEKLVQIPDFSPKFSQTLEA